jgi:predicted permease
MPILDHLIQDVRFAIRQLRARPGFTATAIFILALGLCASASIFAFTEAALLKPLPYADPSRLVGVFESVQMFPRSNLSYPDYLDWKARNTVLDSLEIYDGTGFLLTGSSGTEPVRGARVSAGFFRTLGVAPALGRDFRAGEDLPAAPRTTLVSYAAWQRRYGGTHNVLGQTVVSTPPALRHHRRAAAAFTSPGQARNSGRPSTPRAGATRDAAAMASTASGGWDGVSIEAALANLKSVAQQLEQQYPDSNRGQGAAIAALKDVIVGDIRPILLVLLGGAGLLLLIANVNVAGLLLVRFESRTREVAVRAALGATSGRLLSQFVTEAVVLSASGTLIGLASARWAMQLLTRLIPADVMGRTPFLHGLDLNVRVAGFAAVAWLMSIALFSLAPSLRLWSPKLREGLADGVVDPRALSGAGSVPNSSCWNWPRPWSCSWARGCSARASIVCCMWTWDCKPIVW